MRAYTVCFVKVDVDFFSGEQAVVDTATAVVAALNRDDARELAIRILKLPAEYQWAYTDEGKES